MYNKDLKVQYIRQYTTSRRTAMMCESAFNAVEKFEAKAGKDICTFSEDELRPVLEEITTFRFSYSNPRIAILRQYNKWCVEIGVKGANDGIMRATFSATQKIKLNSVANPIGLQKYLDQVFDQESKETADNVCRCFLWLGFSGVSEDDALLLTKDDVSLEDMEVYIGGNSYPIYRESISSIRNCLTLNGFIYRSDGKNRPVVRDRVYGNTILRIYGESDNKRLLRNAISRKEQAAVRSGRTDARITFERALYSGYFYRVLSNEISGIKPDYYMFYREIARTIHMDNMNDSNTKRVAKSLLKDYLSWKDAFLNI